MMTEAQVLAVAKSSSNWADVVQYAGGDEAFALWLWRADVAARKNIRVSLFDLADYCYRDAYDAGDSPREVVRAALAAEGF